MQRALVSALLILVPSLAACDRKKPEGALPPATDWQAPTAGAPPMGGPPPTTGGGAASDPHAGVPGAPPLGGTGGADPHAGVPGAPPLGAAGGAADPHAGVDVTTMGLPAPDPDRPVDPSKVLAGTIDLPAALRDKVPAGAAIFISVRTRDPASGEGRGAPIAVDKLVATGAWPMPWKLTEAQAMIGGTGFAGDVVVSVRFDQDSDAMSKQPGDITGKVSTTIPASGLKVVLDTTL